MKRNRLPRGISDYDTLISEGYIYIDKTIYLEYMENVDRYLFFLRPRRFGKSLFTSILEYYYGINYAKDFDRLFGNTYIGQNPTPYKNSYYILKFSFTALQTETKEKLFEDFRNAILVSLKKFENKYKIPLDYDKTGEPAHIMDSFLEGFQNAQLQGKAEGKIYLIIDEYDHFSNELISFQLDLFSEIVSKTGFVRKWYEKIKDATGEGTVGRFFATGVTPITLDSITSGFNIAKDYTREIYFNEMMGFTEKEVRFLIGKTLGSQKSDEKRNQILQEMKYLYNGYLFSEDADEKLFNSNMVLNYLSDYFQTGKPPKKLLDASIASDYSKMANLFKLKNETENRKVLQSIIEGSTQKVVITQQFNMENDFGSSDFTSLLFYLGYLTIQGYFLGEAELGIPNYVTKELYLSYFEKSLREEYKYDLDSSDVREALRLVATEGDNRLLVKCVETVLASMSNRDSIRMDEKYVKTICFTLCSLSSIYAVESENEVNKGYSDLQLIKRPGVDADYYGIFEFKYLSMENGTEENIRKKYADAKEQLIKYGNAPKFKGMKNLKKWAIVFVGDSCVLNDEVFGS